MVAEPSTSSHGNQKTFCISNLTAGDVCEILQTCESEQSDIELTDSETYSDTDREPEVNRYDIGVAEVESGHHSDCTISQ
jgi:hypothetical protein